MHATHHEAVPLPRRVDGELDPYKLYPEWDVHAFLVPSLLDNDADRWYYYDCYCDLRAR